MSERSLGYALLDNVIGFDDDYRTAGERLGSAIKDNPRAVAKSVVDGVTGSIGDFATRVREEGPASALTGSLQDYSESILGAGLNLSSGTQGYMDRGMTQAEARDAQLGDAMLVSELIPLVGGAGLAARSAKSVVPEAPSDPSRRDFMAKGAAAAGVAAIMPEELLKQAGKALKPAAATKVIPSVIDVFSQNMKILRKEMDEAYDAADEVFDEQEAGYLSSDSLSDNAKALYEEQLIKAERLHAELDATTEQELREVISDMGPKDIKEASDESLEELSNALNDFRSISEQEFIEQMIPLSEEIKKRGLLNLKNEKGIFQYPNARTVVEDVEDFKVGENRDPFGGLKSDKKFAEGGEVMNRMEQGIASIPRQTMIRDQPHMLAYITPAEAMLLKQNGGSGLPSHGGVPEFGAIGDFFSSMANDFAIGTGMKEDPGQKYNIHGAETPYEKRHRENLERQKEAAEYYSSNKDNEPLVQVAQPMYRPPEPVNVAPPTMTPISSGQPMVPMNTDEQTTTSVTNPSDVIARPPVMPIGQRPANKAYTFQELLGMYQNPYA
jgi:hypothetical protein